MKVTFAVALVAAAGSVNGAAVDLNRRAVTCSTILSNIAATNGQTAAATYCRRRLAIKQVIATQTNTRTVTTTATTRSTTTKVRTVVPPTSLTTVRASVTLRSTVTPDRVTTTATVTSNAYIDNDGNTIAVMKRAEPTGGLLERDEGDDVAGLEKRQTTVPAAFAGLNNADLNAACACLNLQPLTSLKTASATATATKVSVLPLTAQATVTAAVPIKVVTVTNLQTLIVTAPAPVATLSVTVFNHLNQCPPNMLSDFICPGGTSADDSTASDQTQLACGVLATDNFAGYCYYWDDDGSPAGSVLTSEDDNTSTRTAVYGDDPTSDDCPAWADYVCSAQGGSRKRWFEDNQMSPMHVARSAIESPRKLQAVPEGLVHSGKLRHVFRPSSQ